MDDMTYEGSDDFSSGMADALDLGENQWDVTDTGESLDLDQTLEDTFPDNEIDFDDIETVNNTDVANFNESDLTTTEEVTDYLEESIPPEHLDGVDSIEYVDDQQAYEEGVLGQAGLDPETGSSSIEIFPHDDTDTLYDTIAHEVGHNAEEKLGPETKDQWNDIHKQSVDKYTESGGEQDEFVTDYAHKNSSEDFAETYAFYVNDPPYVEAVSTDKHDFMKDSVFGGR